MRELVVVRHGESEGNAQGLAQGRLPYPLTEAGRAQAAAAADVVRALGWEPTGIVSSPVQRCVETSAIVAERLGLPAAAEDAAFTEIDTGRATGMSYAELRRKHPGFVDRPASEWLGFKELGGESDTELIARVGEGLDRLPGDARLLLVTHGAVFKGVLAHLLGLKSRFFLGLRYATCLRLERKRIVDSEVIAWTHLVHADEWVG